MPSSGLVVTSVGGGTTTSVQASEERPSQNVFLKERK